MKTMRYLILLMTLLVSQYCLQAQTTTTTTTELGREWSDTAKIPASGMAQHTEFLNNQQPYPAKPRNMWELGIGVGPAFIFGDVASKIGVGGNLTLRKAISHVFSLRAGYTGMLTYGEAKPSLGMRGYTNRSHMLGLDLIASLNAASGYRGNPKTDWYLLAGYNLIGTQVEFDDVASGSRLFYPGDPAYPYSNNALITTVGKGDSWGLFHGLNAGLGVAFKLSPRANLGIEQKFTFIARGGYDYLDGYRAGNNSDYYSLSTVRLNFNLGNATRRTEPLWWINPNNYVYSEINSPRHMKLPPVVLPDADGDGVTDQFDLEPNTPAGAPVDAHGRAKDTDGDGVPDYRDKEILTPLKCFPVNNDGVGTCPEPACCKEIKDMMANMAATQPKNECNIGNLPSIQFSNNSAKLSRDAQSMLATAAAKIIANPNCKVKVTGYGASSKAAQQMSWERVNAVIKYLVEKQGVAENRFIFSYGQDGTSNTVDLQGTTEDGPNTVPSPYPNLRKG